MSKRFPYPAAPPENIVDEYFGVTVPDPYRWLEDPDSPRTRVWIEAQNELTFRFLESIPARDPLRKRLTELWDYERFGLPVKRGGRYFYQKNDGLQNQSVLYVASSLDAGPRVLLDPNLFSPDGTVALSGCEVSEDGSRIAYGLATAGSDWVEWKFRNVDTGEDLPDLLRWLKFSSVAWTPDGAGVFYSRYPEPVPGAHLEETNYYNRLYFHRMNTDQAEDLLVYERPEEKDWGFSPTVTDDGKYLILTVWRGTDAKYRIYYRDLTVPDSAIIPLIDEFDAEYSFIDNDGPLFWFKTNKDAPRGCVVQIDIRNSSPKNWKEIIPQSEETLESVSCVNHRFLATFLKDAHTQVRIFDLQGTLVQSLSLPATGTAGGFGGKRSDTETFFAFTGFTIPATIYRYDLVRNESTVFRKPNVGFDPDQYETIQVFYDSKDGTRIPMFLSYKRGLQRNGNNPTLLYGYGGFNVSVVPAFSVSMLVWMEMGGIYASANLRGGGEYGEEWHRAGTGHRKQNVFDDFVGAAEWLIAHAYTCSSRLAIYGGSNGGLLVGACLNQRPDLFGAGIAAVGVMDMLRFHKFTIGWAWIDDYGSPEDPEDFRVLYGYSPLQNIRPGTSYPAVLITTADHDDRVVPAHSFKYAAALQAAQAGEAPILIRIEVKAGHGAGKPTSKLIDEAVDRLAFLIAVLEMSI